MRVSAGCLVGACLLAGCGSTEMADLKQQVREEMVRYRYGHVTSIDDVVIYRDGDMKSVCMVVTRENDWGEVQPPLGLHGTYNFNSGTWYTGNPFEIDETFDCAAYAAEHGEILAD